jgi:ABC-type Fe3+/spermidine/putrescine transport system ATPase subunit
LIAAGASGGATPAAGNGVRAIVRPEDLKLSIAAGAGDVNAMRGVIRAVMFSGAHVEYRLDVGERQLHVRSESNRTLLREGQEVAITVDPAAVYVFPGE